MNGTVCQEVTTRRTKVVGLVDPRNGLIRIVFETVKTPKYCLNVMISGLRTVSVESHFGQLPKNRWLFELLELGLMPNIRVLGSELEKGSKWEFIRKYRETLL